MSKEMKKAGVAFDSWKEKTFKKLIGDAGFEFEVGPGLTPGTKLMTVQYDPADYQALEGVIRTANTVCARMKRGGK